MKTTLEIDDVLYREVKALSGLTGRKVGDLVSEGLRHVLTSPVAKGFPAKGDSAAALAELRQWFEETDHAMRKATGGPGALVLLETGRQRL